MWPVIEFTFYTFLLLVLLIMMITKLSTSSRQSNIEFYEKKLQILHKRFLYNIFRKQKTQCNPNLNRQTSQITNNLKNLAQITPQRRESRGSIIGGIGNFKTNDEQLQKVNLQNIQRLVKLNGEGFKQSEIQDIKLYQKIKENQLEEYQNIVINRRFQDIKAIQYSKWKLAWYMVKLQLKRKNVLLHILYEKRLGYFHKLSSIFVFILEMLVILTVCQSIRRTFLFSWYNLNRNIEEEEIQSQIVYICIITQFVIVSPLFLLVQMWIESTSSDFSEVKKKITRKVQSKHCLCVIMGDQGSVNALITAVIFIIGVYEGICLYAELNYNNIDFSIFVTWISLCIGELLFFRNFYIITYAIAKYYIAKDKSLKDDIRMTLFIYYIIDTTKKNGQKFKSAAAARKSMLRKLKSQKQKKEDLFEDEEHQSQQHEDEKISTHEGNQGKIESNLQQKVSQKEIPIITTNNNINNNNQINIIDESNNEYEEDDEEDDLSDDIYDEEEEESYQESKNNQKDNKNQQNKLENIPKKYESESQNNCINNNILTPSILNNLIKNTNSIDTCNKGDSINQCQLEKNESVQADSNQQNQQNIKKLTEDLVENSLVNNDDNGKRLNTSFAFEEESVIQDEYPVTLETVEDQKIPKNKKNFTYTRILSQTSEGYLHQISQIYSPNFGYKQISSVIKSFNSSDIQDASSYSIPQKMNESLEGITQNQKQQNKYNIINKNDKSFTINREIAIGKVHNLDIKKIMNLQEQKKFENDSSFLKNLVELKQIKDDNFNPGNKTPNDVSIFGNKDTSSFMINEEQILNINQKNFNANTSFFLNKSELLEILKPNGINAEQNA